MAVALLVSWIVMCEHSVTSFYCDNTYVSTLPSFPSVNTPNTILGAVLGGDDRDAIVRFRYSMRLP